MPRKSRKAHTATEKVAILRRHLIDHVAVSDLCDERQVPPTQFHRWRRQFFENGASAFASSARVDRSPLEAENAALKAKLAKKHEAPAELMEEHIRLKKERGEI
jgi:transposase-like protein